MCPIKFRLLSPRYGGCILHRHSLPLEKNLTSNLRDIQGLRHLFIYFAEFSPG